LWSQFDKNNVSKKINNSKHSSREGQGRNDVRRITIATEDAEVSGDRHGASPTCRVGGEKKEGSRKGGGKSSKKQDNLPGKDNKLGSSGFIRGNFNILVKNEKTHGKNISALKK